jgi:uncharacterized membrane protein YqiK
MEVETSWTAVVALVISIIAIILIIIIVFLFRNNSSIITNQLDAWFVRDSGTSGTATTPEVFVASPNSILRIVPTIPAGYTVAIAQYTNIASVVVNGRTTLFKIVNTAVPTPPATPQPVAIVGASGVTVLPTSVPAGNNVLPGTTATYMWISPTSVQRIS